MSNRKYIIESMQVSLPGWLVHTELFVYFLCALLVAPALAADIPSLYGEVCINQKVANCGLNVTSFALAFSGKSVDMVKLEASLDIGSGWDRPADMLHIKNTLVEAGLNVLSFEEATFEDVAAELKKMPRSFAIMHMKRDVGELGHFVILISSNKSELMFVDVGQELQWMSIEKLNNYYKGDFSGMFLLVRPAEPGPPKFVLDGKDIVVEAGEITGRGMLNVTAWLLNPEDKPVVFKDARGNCSCFKGALLESPDGKTIPPHEARKIILTFNKEQLEAGNVLRETVVSFDGLQQPWVKIIIRGHISVDTPPKGSDWFPEAINIGLVPSFSHVALEKVIVRTPPNVTLSNLVTSSNSIKAVLAPLGPDNVRKNEQGMMVREIFIDVTGFTSDRLYETVSISTSDSSVPKIVIPIAGEIRKKVAVHANIRACDLRQP